MPHKIVIDLDVECETEDVDAIVRDLEEWFSGGGHETQAGIAWDTSAVQVTYDGLVGDVT